MDSSAVVDVTDRLPAASDVQAAGLGAPPAACSLGTLGPGSCAVVLSVGSRTAPLTALERRLLELGFVHGEQVEVLAAAPGGDPFVVRIGSTTLALRRREVQAVWVELKAHHDRDER